MLIEQIFLFYYMYNSIHRPLFQANMNSKHSLLLGNPGLEIWFSNSNVCFLLPSSKHGEEQRAVLLTALSVVHHVNMSQKTLHQREISVFCSVRFQKHYVSSTTGFIRYSIVHCVLLFICISFNDPFSVTQII